MESPKNPSRRDFIQKSSIAGAAALFTSPLQGFASADQVEEASAASKINPEKPIKTKAYAAMDDSGVLKPWSFERRALGDNDILIEVKFASICHSDIHQEKGHWGPQQYPHVPGHEIVGVVAAVGKNVSKFKVGDRAGVGCMVDSCMECDSCTHGEEQFCERGQTVYTYGSPMPAEPSGISQGGYSNTMVVRDHFAVHIPDHISFEKAAPLLCAGITTYSPLMKARFNIGDKVGVVGIGGLGHLAVKLAVSKGAELYAFTTSAAKIEDVKSWGAKEVIVVDETFRSLAAYSKTLDYMICTIPYQFNAAPYVACVKPDGYFTYVGMPEGFQINLSNIALAATRVNFNASLIGGIPETQEVLHYCADNGVMPEIEIISADQINEAWDKVVNKEARYRYVIDASTF
ncbi:alcohol dehydrogenase catalytic domain-containing protein [Croceimicrobium hydrocarbonivorans]|uniref:Alcohol dehydrogenase catalytic domain-containing protein n=1 Tax=Croceimicrobium hydrocarbonivorans TaxID=2761580 RepID=A0A7H0VES7_9FLAO|nr:alcohol dehydrogenase catalytic domain-containing protein [Croceimicrobium hydrocarbonivorans]QNR24225.1 alcohol dehydrogenase catalytic domain-containing protein [Croceimicrobium hydrocarbonivorans]